MIERELSDEEFAKIAKLTGRIMTAIKDIYPDSMTTNAAEGGIVSNQLTLVLAIALGTQARNFGGSPEMLKALIENVVVAKLKEHAINMFHDLDPASPHNLAYELMPIKDDATQQDIEKFLGLVDSIRSQQKGKAN